MSAASVRAAAGVIAAAMGTGHGTPAELAAAEESAGLLFDPQVAEEIAAAAREQERDRLAAEIRATIERGQGMPASTPEAITARAGRIRGLRAALRLVRCRRGQPQPDEPITYVLTDAADRVAELEATELDVLRAYAEATEQRHEEIHTLLARVDLQESPAAWDLGMAIAAILDGPPSGEPTDQPCRRPGCGATDREVAEADTDVYGWIRVRVCGIDGPPQWWCSPRCAQRAISDAGQQLAEADTRAGGEG